MNKEDLKRHYSENRSEIESRLEEFRQLRKASDERLFRELCFVILTSQSSAENAWEAVNILDEQGSLSKPEKEDIESVLAENDIQYEKRKADFIVENFEFLSQPTFGDPSKSMKIKSRIKPDELEKSREWLVERIKGLSWKGASHFMRNIGYGGSFAILSSHTISVLFDLDVLKISEPPKSKSEYLRAEEKIKEFSEDIGIDIQALDLVLWSYRTGKVFR